MRKPLLVVLVLIATMMLPGYSPAAEGGADTTAYVPELICSVPPVDTDGIHVYTNFDMGITSAPGYNDGTFTAVDIHVESFDSWSVFGGDYVSVPHAVYLTTETDVTVVDAALCITEQTIMVEEWCDEYPGGECYTSEYYIDGDSYWEFFGGDMRYEFANSDVRVSAVAVTFTQK